jgi:hypothetical protein
MQRIRAHRVGKSSQHACQLLLLRIRYLRRGLHGSIRVRSSKQRRNFASSEQMVFTVPSRVPYLPVSTRGSFLHNFCCRARVAGSISQKKQVSIEASVRTRNRMPRKSQPLSPPGICTSFLPSRVQVITASEQAFHTSLVQHFFIFLDRGRLGQSSLEIFTGTGARTPAGPGAPPVATAPLPSPRLV